MTIVSKLRKLQEALTEEISKSEPDEAVIKKLRGQIAILGMQLTPLDIYKIRK